MSLRLLFEEKLADYLTTVSPSKPSALQVQAAHKITELEMPALVIHAESAETMDEGIQTNTRKITVQASVMTPIQETATVPSHTAAFLWAEARLKDRSAIISGVTAGVTILGSYIQSERTESNERAMSDSFTAVFYVDPA
ncbi:MAG: hypothetical protein EBS49_00905 [Verrucomicrobia bacterium]|nr:hypothetical protein [Verrucomicrobiota bacterium]NBU68186.1 hypothetical protein [Verrucomicrobiota bacterium]